MLRKNSGAAMKVLPSRGQWRSWSLPSRLTAIGVALGVVGIAVSIFAVLMAVLDGVIVQSPSDRLQIPSISVPGEQALVGSQEPLRGDGAATGHWYYPVVESLQTGGVFVAGYRIRVERDGTWQGLASVGDAGTTSGAPFLIRICESAGRLSQGPVVDLSGMLLCSKGVNVKRR